jgi:molybdopterin/thiamine biosynthesis adenylyltransferase
VQVVGHEIRLDSRNVEAIPGGYDLVVDGSDNFPTR